MKFNEARAALDEGKKISRPGFHPAAHVKKHHGEQESETCLHLVDENGKSEQWSPADHDLAATDWQIHGEEGAYPEKAASDVATDVGKPVQVPLGEWLRVLHQQVIDIHQAAGVPDNISAAVNEAITTHITTSTRYHYR